METQDPLNLDQLKEKVELLRKYDDGSWTEAISYFDQAFAITEQYEFDLEGGMDACLLPQNPKEAFELFKKTGGQFQLEVNKGLFLLENGSWDEEQILQLLKETERFKEKSKSYSYLSTVASIPNRDVESEASWLQEYLCLTGDIYNSIAMQEIGLLSFRSRVYGEYVLFANFLQQKLLQLQAKVHLRNCSESKGPSKMQVALYFYYLQEAGIKERFDNHKHGKIAALKEASSAFGYTAWKRFQKHYTNISSGAGEAERTKGGKRNLDNLKTVIEMLKEYPDALVLAERDLRKAEDNT